MFVHKYLRFNSLKLMIVGRPGVQSPCRVIPKNLKNGIHSFSAWCSAFKRGCGEQAGKFACCVLGQGTERDASAFMWKTGGEGWAPPGVSA